MQGLELSRKYYEEYGREILEEQFGGILDKIAVGLAGSGSECFGFDDGISTDHDFEPGFIIFIPGEDIIDRRTEFRLQRAYSRLPEEFMGTKRGRIDPVGGNRHGVIRTADFYTSKCGSPDGRLTSLQWLRVPEYALAEAVNGEVFFDGYGEFSGIRDRLKRYPGDIRIKKLAGYLLLMAQSGQYNYSRCVKRGETGAAQLAVHEFVNAAMHIQFLLNESYMPYYKWSFRALRELPGCKAYDLPALLEYLISSGNGTCEYQKKSEYIEAICALTEQQVYELMGKTACIPKCHKDYYMQSDAGSVNSVSGMDLEKLAYELNDSIRDGNLRNMHILAGV